MAEVLATIQSFFAFIGEIITSFLGMFGDIFKKTTEPAAPVEPET